MTDRSNQLGEFGFAGDDKVVPFQVDGLDVRGRAVQLGQLLNSILDRHAYPPAVARLLAEAIVLTVLIGTSLKFEGKFVVQTKSDGPVDLLVCDFATPENVRAYARFDEERLAESLAAGKSSPTDLLGNGVLAFTIDQGGFMQPYQGIVPLDGSSLEDIAGFYFRQSEQIPTRVRLAVAELFDRDGDGKPRHTWRAGGILVQFLPEAPERMGHQDLPGDGDDNGDYATPEHDNWTEARMMADTIDGDELTDPLIGTERLLFRLFHERGVRAYTPQPIYDRCSCSRDKIKGVLSGFSAEEITASVEDGAVSVTCEFCSTTYKYEPQELMPA
ncbi:Hsp33 family molecular chaperone [Rhizobium oryziradicis]|uniref:Hsp33 family molecular chaperone n=1 Tax=Rhizobium oryziradicis TaxID=1867956 RepID=A0A1Q8ZT52_9HYPH|nr:Hsp33 family molecular chaperone [Rhizobium oryziradicis]OLP45118.1 Hsp33 family molecular chaperone [Rhizobium oryziradicis]